LAMKADVEKIKNMMTGPDKSSDTEVDEAAEEKPEVVFDDFMKLDLRAGESVIADRIKRTDKVLLLQVDLGNHKRQILSGIAKYYTPSELIGKKVICVTNLKPVKLR